MTITPHIAEDSEPEVICAYVAAQIERHQKGLPMLNLVDVKRGY